jgi:hypothetical protein
MLRSEELLRLYWEEVWNNGNVELVREICADPIVRHDPGATTALSHNEQIARITQQRTERRPQFTHEVIVADEHHATSVWNMVTRAGERIELCGIEVFQIEDGRLARAWNSSYLPGFWGREHDTATPQPLPPPALLQSLSQVDREWLQRVFAAADYPVPRIALVTSVTPIGHGTMSETARVEIAYNADASDAPPSVICKFGALNPAAQALNAQFGFFTREAETYRFFGEDSGFRTPRSWLSKTDEFGTGVNLVLEDLSQTGRPGNQIAGCSYQEARAVVEELAVMHVRYWQASELGQATWLYDRSAAAGRLADAYQAGADIFHQRFEGRLSDGEFETIDRFRSHVRTWASRDTVFRTLVHSDARLDNIIFEAHEHAQIRACLIDWQLTGFDDPAIDLTYFLSGSVLPEDRRQWEQEFIAMHADKLSEVETGYTLGFAMRAYRRNIPTGLVATIGAAVAIASTPHTDELLLALCRRNCAAIQDWGGVDEIVAAAGFKDVGR